MEPPAPPSQSSYQVLPPAPGRPQYRPTPYLLVRARADRKVAIGAVFGGAFFDIAARSGVATVAIAAWLAAVAAAILLGGRLRGGVSRVLVAAAPVFGLLLVLRSSPWVIAPTVVAVLVLLLLGVSLGADGGDGSTTFPALVNRVAVVVGHLVIAPGMFRFATADPPGRGDPPHNDTPHNDTPHNDTPHNDSPHNDSPRKDRLHNDVAQKRAAAVVRGVLLGLPILVVVGLLLAGADPIFRSWFDLAPLLKHLALGLVGAWVVVGLSRAASAKDPSPAVQPVPSLGTVEASFVLGGLSALYGAFVVAQFVALSGAGHRILVTAGLTYAQYARSGFFQLLASAAITLVVLLGVRACTDKSRLVPALFAGLTTALTLGVVVVAIRRLQLYEAAYGLTMLRLASLVVAIWIGAVFVLLGMTIWPHGLSPKLFPATVIASGLILIAAWGISNPASIVAVTDVRRAAHGHRLDIQQAARLGPDAIPALIASLSQLDAATRHELRQAICAQSVGKDTGTAFNTSRSRAATAITHSC